MSIKKLYAFRMDDDLALGVRDLMKAMEYENLSKFIRKMLKTMVKNGKKKGII